MTRWLMSALSKSFSQRLSSMDTNILISLWFVLRWGWLLHFSSGLFQSLWIELLSPPKLTNIHHLFSYCTIPSFGLHLSSLIRGSMLSSFCDFPKLSGIFILGDNDKHQLSSGFVSIHRRIRIKDRYLKLAFIYWREEVILFIKR